MSDPTRLPNVGPGDPISAAEENIVRQAVRRLNHYLAPGTTSDSVGQAGAPLPARAGGNSSPPFHIRPTGVSAVVSTHIWAYEWEEMVPVFGGGYEVKTGGRTHETHGLAYNDFEVGNDADRVGNVYLPDVEGDVTVFDASDNTPVVQARIIRYPGGDIDVRFFYPNRIRNICEEV